jgi:hypothetical protein
MATAVVRRKLINGVRQNFTAFAIRHSISLIPTGLCTYRGVSAISHKLAG